ncbi:MAG: HD-GYP domain-containing protein [Planctomycetes bacterium]|nr:HD-GYP domain-containing protein [Planctomycetota bacterium]
MKRIPVSALTAVKKLRRPFYHKSGWCLFNAQEEMLREHVAALAECGVDYLYELEPGDSATAFEAQARYREVALADVKPLDLVAVPVTAPDGTLVARGGERVDRRLRLLLQRYGVATVQVERDAAARAEVDRFLARKKEIIKAHREKKTFESRLREVKMVLAPEGLTEESVQRQAAAPLADAPSGQALEGVVAEVDPRRAREADVRRHFEVVYERALGQVRDVFDRLIAQDGADATGAGRQVDELISLLVKDRALFLALHLLKKRDDYLYGHALHVALLGINTATALGYSEHQVLEVGYGALLADLGMIRVQDSVVRHRGPLNPEQTAQVRRHPALGLEVLRRLRGVPETTPLVVYQTHERADGSGYPRGAKAEGIHRFAQIVAVADVYDAMISERPFRPPMTPYVAMENILFEVQKGRFDASVVRGLLRYLSLFPVGSWVRLSDGRFARVIAANADRHTLPWVRVLYHKNRRPIAEPEIVDLSSQSALRIEEALTAHEFDASPLDAI